MGSIITKIARIIIFNAMLLIFVIPGLKVTVVLFLQSENAHIVFYGKTCFYILIVLLAFLEYSWTTVIFMNPGKLSVDIKLRGHERLSHFTPCNKCGLPKPPRCHHCSRCGCCILYMDHHCDSIGACLGYRNFKVFILVLFYGSVTCAYASLVMVTSPFLTKGSRPSQIVLAIFLALISLGLHLFAKIYITLNRNNCSTIDNLYPMHIPQPDLPRINLLDSGIWSFIPTPPHLDPFLFFE